jgi:hypothetical protein
MSLYKMPKCTYPYRNMMRDKDFKLDRDRKYNENGTSIKRNKPNGMWYQFKNCIQESWDLQPHTQTNHMHSVKIKPGKLIYI